ncbi:hypothetical protein JQ608_06745 [Bradyrhizobium liaoningense]|uniref:hypothetical protein n=1 Tax=Bradyrhizobium liaoningense TaxID=43992 RepID=UPI001BA7C0DD|nr:hypothetical protein [Bradyrhizobium liaoningense]MBR0876899.1 hypothetical protein [Bradyrhizobium liaoningense]
MSLEELIADAARRGELNHLSIIGTEHGFHAVFRVASGAGHSSGASKDPVEALRAALTGAKMARAPRGPTMKPTPEPDPVSTTDDEMDFG